MAFDPKALLQRTAATPRGELRMDVVLGRAAQLRRRRRGTVAACVVAILVAGSLAVAREWPGSSIPPSKSDESPTPRDENGIQRFRVSGGAPSRLAVGAGSVWAANTTGPGWTVTRLDESTGEIQAEITLPGYTRAIAFGEGLVWAFVERDNSRRSVTVVDPETNEVVTTSSSLFDTNVTESYASIAVGDGAAWVAFRGRLYRIELDRESSQTFVTTSDLPRPFRTADRDSGPYAVAFGGGSVWVGKVNGGVARIDPATTEAVGEVERLDWNLIDITAGSASLWIVHTTPPGRHRLLRLDYVTGEVTKAAVDLGKFDQYWEAHLGGSSLWFVRSAKGENIIELDELSGAEIQRFRFPVQTFFGAAASDSALWIGTRRRDEGEIIRVPSKR